MLEDGEQRALRQGAATPTELGRSSALEGFVPRRRRTDIRDGSGIAETAPSGKRSTARRRLPAPARTRRRARGHPWRSSSEAPCSRPTSSTAARSSALPLIVFAAKTLGLYDRDELVIHKTTLNDAPKLFYMTTLFTLVYTVVQADLQDTTIATETILVLWAILMCTVMAGRWTARRIARSATPSERCVLVGDTAHAQRVKRMLDSHPTLSAELVAVIPFQRVTARGEDAERVRRVPASQRLPPRDRHPHRRRRRAT